MKAVLSLFDPYAKEAEVAARRAFIAGVVYFLILVLYEPLDFLFSGLGLDLARAWFAMLLEGPLLLPMLGYGLLVFMFSFVIFFILQRLPDLYTKMKEEDEENRKDI